MLSTDKSPVFYRFDATLMGERCGSAMLRTLVVALICSCGNPSGATDADAGGVDSGTIEVDAGCAFELAPAAGRVVTDRGTVDGVRVGSTYAYRGIPFAQPPVGELRWKPPQPAACWSGAKRSVSYGFSCVQRDSSGSVVGSEDCLTLNVWTPANPSAQRLPVLVFVHGGSNVTGAASLRLLGVDVYDGQALSELGPAVVVTLNYRLGSLGFLVHDALGAENAHGASGNYGLLDQIEGLRWVQRNIAAFGGDPSRVLLFGHSAGAIDTCSLVASPLAKGLFSRAMMLSGSCNVLTKAVAQQAGAGVSARLQCDHAADVATCLRSRSAVEVIQAPVSLGAPGVDSGSNGANVDGWVLPDSPLAMISRGAHNKVPIILSTTEDEFTSLLGAYGSHAVATDAEYRAELAAMFGEQYADAIKRLYPSTNYSSPTMAMVAVLSDAWFICPTRKAARTVVAAQSEPVYRAHFTHTFSNGPLVGYGAAHGWDLWFGFDRLDYTGFVPSTAETGLAAAIGGYWTRFAATGDPNGSGSPTWPRYEASADAYLRLDTPPAAGAGIHTAACNVWAP